MMKKIRNLLKNPAGGVQNSTSTTNLQGRRTNVVLLSSKEGGVFYEL